MAELLEQGLEQIVGGKSAKALAKAMNINTAGELIRHYPRRYDRRGQLSKISGLERDEHVTVLARVVSVRRKPMQKRKGTVITVIISDGNRNLSCVFFNWVENLDKLEPGVEAMFAGKVSMFNKTLQLAHPEFELLEELDMATGEFAGGLIPIYPASTNIQTWTIRKCMRLLLDVLDTIPDPLDEALRDELSLIPLDDAIRFIHRPTSDVNLKAAEDRLKWDEALSIQLALTLTRNAAATQPAPACPPKSAGIAAAFEAKLPFTLTDGQREVGDIIGDDISGSAPMNRLLQGEVGSGKTIVALRAMLQVVDSGKQAALLAPTEVLAAQHARSLSAMLGELAMAGELGGAENATRLTLLTGSMSAPARKQALLDVVSGTAGIVIGTHAIIQDKVSFADLGLVVVDEQHRFGVEQRDALRGRGSGDSTPHVLVMTATPIPRTVAMTVYGDLEISALRELPKGRSPITTNVIPVAEHPGWLYRAWQRVVEEVKAGHQAYIVCPRIGETEEEAAANAAKKGAAKKASTAVDDGAFEEEEAPPDDDESARRPPLAVLDTAERLTAGPLSGLKVAILHGKLPADERNATMRAFTAGELDVLVATTVIEVGVDVPNATVMVIMDADRFGISQLHQLRGRVGRGSAPGLCLLTSEAPDGSLARERLSAVASTVDGFQLARADLELRREGDILGASQSGKRTQLKMLSLLRDEDVIAIARHYAQSIVDGDPELAAHPGMATMVAEVLDEQRAKYLLKV